MSMTHFERLVKKAMDECAMSSLRLPLGDSHRHALIKGHYEGLERAMTLYRQAIREDVENEDG